MCVANHRYSCLAFNITADGTAATDIEHIVALAETHDSGIADDRPQKQLRLPHEKYVYELM